MLDLLYAIEKKVITNADTVSYRGMIINYLTFLLSFLLTDNMNLHLLKASSRFWLYFNHITLIKF